MSKPRPRTKLVPRLNIGPRIEWQSVGMFFLLVRRPRPDRRRKGRQLAITVAYDPHDGWWVCIALESVSGRGPAVLDDHAHKRIGEFIDVRSGMIAAEDFARAWLAHAGELEKCPCGDIEAAPSGKVDKEPLQTA